jgi:uncharacterized glyoxalase superfamily protein PhnB
MNDQPTVSPIRQGFRTITPYLFAQNAASLIEFISKAFGGEETYRKERPDGAITHAEMRVKDSMLMLGEATTQVGRCRGKRAPARRPVSSTASPCRNC